MTRYKTRNMIDRDVALDMLTSSFAGLKIHWEKYKIEKYKDYQSERLDYLDIGEVSNYIVDKLRTNEIKEFNDFFSKVETILNDGDDYTIELIIIGLLEGIQNRSGGYDDFDYHKDFDKWLRPKTKDAWDKLIFFWESEDSG